MSFYSYWKHEFKIADIFADGELQLSRTYLAELQINLNCVFMDEHVPEDERFIKMLKECCRCSMYNTLFLKVPNCMVIKLLQNRTFYGNDFPHADGVSELSPQLTIVQVKIINFTLHCLVEFGAYE